MGRARSPALQLCSVPFRFVSSHLESVESGDADVGNGVGKLVSPVFCCNLRLYKKVASSPPFRSILDSAGLGVSVPIKASFSNAISIQLPQADGQRP